MTLQLLNAEQYSLYPVPTEVGISISWHGSRN
jgi:hypothetical protein